MIGLGAACLTLALPLALFAAGAALWGRRAGETKSPSDQRRVDASRWAVYGLAVALSVCVAVLEAAFLRSDFSLQLVADHSSTTTPAFYKLTAMWSSQAGSLLLWAWLLSIFSSAVLFATHKRHREIVPYATAVLAGLGAFFVGLMLFKVSPFVRLSPAPAEGVGLNPLLRNPGMMIHPPMLYLGYVGFSIPFAFAIGALAARRLDAGWIRSTRRWSLIAWTFLSFGVLLGARWSYSELGWGGYWAWDPVENASLMPWLTGTAFLHSVMVQERRGMFRAWNVALIVATFALALLGTFLVRSGVLQSIHAFGASTVGTPLLVLIGIVLAGSTWLIVSRLDELRAKRRLDSLISRESIFLVNNLLLVGLAAVIFWGTFFPLISEALTGTKASLAAPWFNQYTTPLALLLVLFSGIGPLLAWRRPSWEAARRAFAWPVAVAVAVAIGALAFTDAGETPLALVLFTFAAFSVTAVGREFTRGAGARRSLTGESRPVALAAIVARNRRRYGGYVVHIGIAVLLVGVAASSSFQTNRDLRLRPGERAGVGGYELRYLRPTVNINNERISFGAVVDVRREGRRVTVLRPSRNYFRSSDLSRGPIGRFFEGEATSEIGLKAGLTRDLWLAMQPDLSKLERPIADADRRFAKAGLPVQGLAIRAIAESYVNDPPPTNFRAIINPMVSWLWIGALIALAGALLALWPGRPSRLQGRIADPRVAELEIRKQGKYREIRDAEIDHAAGKLSEEDFARLGAELRAEAAAVLAAQDELRADRS